LGPKETGAVQEKGRKICQAESEVEAIAVDISCGSLQLKAVKCSQSGAGIVIDSPGMWQGIEPGKSWSKLN